VDAADELCMVGGLQAVPSRRTASMGVAGYISGETPTNWDEAASSHDIR